MRMVLRWLPVSGAETCRRERGQPADGPTRKPPWSWWQSGRQQVQRWRDHTGLEAVVLASALILTLGQEACGGNLDAPQGHVPLHDHDHETDTITEIGSEEVGQVGSISAPVAKVAPAIRVSQAIATLDASLSIDSDGDPFVVTWTQIEGPPATFSAGTNGLKLAVGVPQDGVYRFRATAWDGDGRTSQEQVVVRDVSGVPRLRFVLHISVDGLHPQAVQNTILRGDAGFGRLIREGASTLNARTDPDFTVTLPNHTSQLTSRFVKAPGGHNWQQNFAGSKDSLHVNAGTYVTSIFDVLHENGLGGALYSGKSKFILYDNSYGRLWDPSGQTPAAQRPLASTVIQPDLHELMPRLLYDLSHAPRPYQFLHIAEPDNKGHAYGWKLDEATDYTKAVDTVDAALASILATIDESPALRGATAIVLTADHGGTGYAHDHISDANNYTIPFLVWGPGIAPLRDLYSLNSTTRRDPGAQQIPFDASLQPIRNGEAANLAAALLGLPPIPGSQLNRHHDLRVFAEPMVDGR